MSVLVKGMDMPENCEQCVLQSDAGFCLAMPKNFCGYTETDKRADFCPLVALPDKHGRLMDADKLIEQMKADAEHMDEPYARMMYSAAISDVRHAPTIVDAEGDE